jgi:hypothetical protein
VRLSHDAAMTKVSPAGGSTPPASTIEGGSANGSPFGLFRALSLPLLVDIPAEALIALATEIANASASDPTLQ